MIKSKQK